MQPFIIKDRNPQIFVTLYIYFSANYCKDIFVLVF